MNFLLKSLYLFYRFSVGRWHWLQLRFTRAGLAVLGALILTTLLAPDTDNNVSYQALPILLLLLALGYCWSRMFHPALSATRVLPRFATAGIPLSYRVTVANLGSKRQIGLTFLEQLQDTLPPFSEWATVERAEQDLLRSFRLSPHWRKSPFTMARPKEAGIPAIPGGQEAQVAVELLPLRRGMLRFEGLVIARTDPLGLVRAVSRLPLPQKVLVLPRRYHLPPIALPGLVKYQERGVALAANVGQSDEYVALRDYRYGDPLRHIHWRSWAKVGKPVVKEFEDEFFVRHALVLDTFTRHPRNEAFEEAVSVAASFACTLPSQESLLDLLFVGPQSYCFTAGRGIAHIDQMLEVLASVRACSEHPFRALESLVLNHLPVVSGCICIFLAWDAERQEFVRKLQAENVPVRVLVVVPAGGSKGLQPGPMSDEPERFAVLEAGRIEQGLAKLT